MWVVLLSTFWLSIYESLLLLLVLVSVNSDCCIFAYDFGIYSTYYSEISYVV